MTQRRQVFKLLQMVFNRRAMTHCLVLFALVVGTLSGAQAQETKDEESAQEEGEIRGKVFDAQDGCFDLSKILDEPLGFVPLIIPITEPALGGGAAAMAVFIDKPEGGGRPNMMAAGLLRTSNGSEGVFGGYSGYFLDERLHMTGGAGDVSMNLDFYGVGNNLAPDGQAFRYNLDSTFGMIGADWKLGKDSHWNIGLRYAYAEVGASLVNPTPLGGNFLGGGIDYVVSSLRPTLLFDSRDNVFTPTRGLVSELSLTANLKALGGGSNFQSLKWANYWYHPLVEDTLFLGIKGEMEQSSGDMPFYMRPYVKLRGAPAARYQGDGIAAVEAELRWQCHSRWSVVGFGGVGMSWFDDHPFKGTDTTVTGGAGIRYLIARQYGLHMGLDVAYGEEGPAIYIQFGSAWARF